LAAKRHTLGRGIGAILEEVEEAYATDIRSNTEAIMTLDVAEIEANPFQPRTQFDEEALSDLARSIQVHGLLQPVVVIRKEAHFVLIAGERRLRASKLLGKETIRAIVADISYGKLRELALIENIQRQDLNPIELARSFKELIEEHELTHEALSEVVGKSRAYVTNMLRLLQLGEYARSALLESRISYGHGKVLVGLDEQQERKVVDSIINQRLSVRDTEALLQNVRPPKEKAKKPAAKPAEEKLDLSDIVITLKAHGIDVAQQGGNRLVVTFGSTQSRDTFLELIEK
jgi:ParB family chromosome partitioning protein